MHARTTMLVIAIALGNCAFGPTLAWAEGGATAETGAYLQLLPGQSLEGGQTAAADEPSQPEGGKQNGASPFATTADNAAFAARCCAAIAAAAAASAAVAHVAGKTKQEREP